MNKFSKFTPDAYRDNESQVKNLADELRKIATKESKDVTEVAKRQIKRFKDVQFVVNTQDDGYQLRLRESENSSRSGEENHALKKGAKLRIVSDKISNNPDNDRGAGSDDAHIFIEVEADLADTKHGQKLKSEGKNIDGQKVRGWVSAEYIKSEKKPQKQDIPYSTDEGSDGYPVKRKKLEKKKQRQIPYYDDVPTVDPVYDSAHPTPSNEQQNDPSSTPQNGPSGAPGLPQTPSNGPQNGPSGAPGLPQTPSNGPQNGPSGAPGLPQTPSNGPQNGPSGAPGVAPTERREEVIGSFDFLATLGEKLVGYKHHHMLHPNPNIPHYVLVYDTSSDPVRLTIQKDTANDTYSFIDDKGKKLTENEVRSSVDNQKQSIEKRRQEKTDWKDKSELTNVIEECAKKDDQNSNLKYSGVDTPQTTEGVYTMKFNGGTVKYTVEVTKNSDGTFSCVNENKKMNRIQLTQYIRDKKLVGNRP